MSLWSQNLIAAVEQSKAFTATEFDWPRTVPGFAVLIVGVLLVVVLSVWVLVRDSRELSPIWRVWLLLLRLGALAGLIVILLNPQERTQRMAFRPSRAVLVVDTSLSMEFPESDASSDDGSRPQTRSEAVVELLDQSNLVDSLRARHDVSIYTFDSELAGPIEVLPARTGENETPQPGVAGDDESLDQTAGAEASADKPPRSESLSPRGVETRLGESLRDLIRDVGGRTLSGVAVFTDGGSNAGVDPIAAQEMARETGTQLFAVGVGSTKQPVNISIASVQSPTDVRIGDPYEITAFIQGQGVTGQSVEVELLARDEDDRDAQPIRLESKSVALLEDGVPAQVVFEQTPSVSGTIEYVLRLRPARELVELSTDDNERRRTIRIFESKTRVLLIAGGPMRDYRFVRNMLFRHAGMEVDVWLQTVIPKSLSQVSQESDNLLTSFPKIAAELFEYDVIIAFDPDWYLLSFEQQELLADWVARHAGGLLLVAGDVNTAQLASADENMDVLRELYPVFLNRMLISFQTDRGNSQPWTVNLTPDGREAGFLTLDDTATATTAEQWKEFDGVYRCYPTGGAKAGASVLAHFSDPRAQTEHGPPILLATQYYGAGRTLFVGTPELWRLRSLSDEYFDRFWIRAIRDLSQGRTERGRSRGLLLVDRNQFVLGQTVRLRAQLYDSQLAELKEESVPVEIFDPEGKPLSPARKLLLDQNRAGQYSGSFRASRPGTWRIELPIPDSTDRITKKVDVVLPNLESDNPRQDVPLLNQLVKDTGGSYLTLDNVAAELPPLLPDRSEQYQIDERLRTLWDREWVLWLIVGMLSLEWLSRKLLKLA